MAIKRIYILIFSLYGLACFGQTFNDAKSINSIKLDTTYLYGEATKAEIGEALTAAKTSLEIRVSEWLKAIHASDGIELCIAKAKEHCSEIKTMRGSFFRIFVYVKKSDILPVTNKNEVVVINVNPQRAEAEPIAEKPLVVEQEVVSDSLASKVVQQTSKPRSDVKLTNEERKMVAIMNKDELEFYLKSINGMGKIQKGKYGNLKTLPEHENCHLFIYNKQKGNVQAVLRKEGSVLLNLKEIKEDDLKNYKNYEVFWFQLR